MSGAIEFQPFVLERFLSKFENAVEYNLSESGAHPLSLRELLGDPKRGVLFFGSSTFQVGRSPRWPAII